MELGVDAASQARVNRQLGDYPRTNYWRLETDRRDGDAMRDTTVAWLDNNWRIERGEHSYWLVKFSTCVELYEPQLGDAEGEGQRVAILYDAAKCVLDELDADGVWWEIARTPYQLTKLFDADDLASAGYLFAFDPVGGVPSWMPKKWREETHVGDWKVVLA
jgi:hypothetical protein